MLNYRQLAFQVEQHPQQELVLFYYTLKTTSGIFKIEPVQEVKAKMTPSSVVSTRSYLHLQYRTKSQTSWSKSLQTAFKNNSYYFFTKLDAEQHMKAHVAKAKRHFEGLIESSQEALDILKNY